MKSWILFALLSMFFAGLTSVMAKIGLTGISGELGLTVRTVFVFILIALFAATVVPLREWNTLSRNNFIWLGLSALTTSLSWIFYYKALKQGEVSTIALIDKGSMVVVLLLAWIFLKEKISAQTLIGGLLMLVGLFVISKK